MTKLELAIHIGLVSDTNNDGEDILTIPFKKTYIEAEGGGSIYYYTIIYYINEDVFALETHSYYGDEVVLNINCIEDIINLSKLIKNFYPNYNLTNP